MLNVPQITTVPTVIAALVAAFGAIDSDAAYGVLEVNDGPKFKASMAHDQIAVGVGNPAVTQRLIFQGRGTAYDEAYDVNCLLWAWSGSKVMEQHRDRCMTLLTAVRGIVDALDIGSNISLRLGDGLEWVQSVSGEGASCSLQFSIHVAATI